MRSLLREPARRIQGLFALADFEIEAGLPHAPDFSLVTDAPPGKEQLILQTSEGPRGTVPKLQVAARPVSIMRATTAEAQPSPQPRVCLPEA